MSSYYNRVLRYGLSGLMPYSPNNIRLIVVCSRSIYVVLHKGVSKPSGGETGVYRVDMSEDDVRDMMVGLRSRGDRYRSFYRSLSDPVCGSLEGIVIFRGDRDAHLDEFRFVGDLAHGLSGGTVEGIRSRFGRLQGIVEVNYSGVISDEYIKVLLSSEAGTGYVLRRVRDDFQGVYLYRGFEDWMDRWGCRVGNYAFDKELDEHFRTVSARVKRGGRRGSATVPRQYEALSILRKRLDGVIAGAAGTGHILGLELRRLRDKGQGSDGKKGAVDMIYAGLRKILSSYLEGLSVVEQYRCLGRVMGCSARCREFICKGNMGGLDPLIMLDALIHDRNYDVSWGFVHGDFS